MVKYYPVISNHIGVQHPSNCKKSQTTIKTINKIQSIIDYWYKIKTDKQYQKFVDMIKNTHFGTYGTISVYRFYFDNENEFKHLNQYHSNQFKKELENISK